MHQDLLDLFAEQLEKQDQLSKLTESEFLHQYGYSDVHSIDFIGNHKDANITQLSLHLKMTRGAASKIVKRLLKQELIEMYTKETNKKEKYYCLTRKGHKLWVKRDTEFFKRYPVIELQYVKEFMKDYNQYLEEQIKSIEK